MYRSKVSNVCSILVKYFGYSLLNIYIFIKVVNQLEFHEIFGANLLLLDKLICLLPITKTISIRVRVGGC